MNPPARQDQARFAPTRWTLVLRARGDSPDARDALAQLCETSYQPIYSFLRGEGRDQDTARELTQEFFARLLAKGGLGNIDPRHGRFRSFLLGALKHFLADLRDHQLAAKRGSGQPLVPLEQGTDTATEIPIPDPAGPAPDAAFDREWAVALVNRALTTLESEFVASGKPRHFEVLKPWLLGEQASGSQAEAARALDLNEGAVKVAIHRLRKRFREVVRNEIAETVDDEADAQDELRYLLQVLSRQP
jgi:RNA polymerase sigma-70 factor (ECF subfamily)